MALICLYILCLYLFKLSSMNLEINPHSIYFNNEDNLFLQIEDFNSDSDFIYSLAISLLEFYKEEPEIFLESLNHLKDSWAEGIENITLNTTIGFLVPMINDIFFNESNTFINDTYTILINRNKSTNDSVFVDCLVNILSHFRDYDILNISYICGNLEQVLNVPGADKLSNYLLRHNDEIFKIGELMFHGLKMDSLFESFSTIFWEYRKKLQYFFYNFIKNYSNNNILYNLTIQFISDFNDTFIEEVAEKVKNDSVLNSLSKIFYVENKIINGVIKAFIKSQEVTQFFIHLIRDEKLIMHFIDAIKNFQNTKYLLESFPDTIKELKHLNQSYVDVFLKVMIKALEKLVSEKEFREYLTNNAVPAIKNYYNELRGPVKENITKSCTNLFDDTFFNNNTDITNYKNFYLIKFLIQSTENKNDIITYENCLHNKNFKEIENFNYTVKPVFVIGMVNDIGIKQKIKSSIYIQKFDYVLGFCFPYGVYKAKNEDGSDNYMCGSEDYNNIIKIILEIGFNMETATINSFNIYDYDLKPGDYFFCFISVLLAIYPFLINGFLKIYKMIKSNKVEKSEIINNLTKEEKTDKKKEKSKNKLNEKKKKLLIFIEPKWYKHLNEYFGIIHNGKELFNFDISETKYNNLNGITYIKGLQGISMILYIFGHTFLILFNIPTKQFMRYEFYQLLKNPLYILPFIGLRYSPHILFSCSGVTLAYKFLCFKDKYYGYHFLKFLILQSYKFILLISAILFTRFSIYYIDLIIWRHKRPIMELYKYFMEEKTDYFLVNFFEYFTNFLGEHDLKISIDIFQYFYVPLNEIIFFILGTILISLGTKFKLRIDYIIIVLFFLILGAKIFVFYWDDNFYSTLYFYSYDYGALIINPIFNLQFFLIGMFFGFINYSIQKGIEVYKSEKTDSYSILNFFEKKNTNDEICELNENKPLENHPQERSDKDLNLIKKNSELNDKSESTNQIKKLSDSNIRFKAKDSDDEEKAQLMLEKKFEEENINNNKKNEKRYTYKIEQNPFLILPTHFLNFHRKNKKKLFFKIVILLFSIFLIFCFAFHFIILYICESKEDGVNEIKKIYDKYSLEKVITNPALNRFYVIDTEIVVFLVNWIFFIFYSNAEKNADIFDFLNHIYWSFFVKYYFSFILVSNVIIIYIFYQSETVITINLYSIIVYSFINIFLIIIFAIIAYIAFELPLKKIFKNLVINKVCCNQETEDLVEEEDFEEDSI